MKRTIRSERLAIAVALLACAAPAPAASGVYVQGPKLVGSNVGGFEGAQQGVSVALSADGNTAIIGGTWDSSQLGAAWVFTRSNGVWKEEQKLVGSDAAGSARQGTAVALSADGSTALVGGSWDGTFVGAAWVFTRSGGVWTQQGPKLVGTGGVGASKQGCAVALSSDGSTALVGGSGDNSGIGAAWVFTRSSGMWGQQGDKLASVDRLGLPNEGASVALSSDGNTAILGGPADNTGVGAAWVFMRSQGHWSPQGGKLVVSDATGAAQIGTSVALSSDGSHALVGGGGDNAFRGAAWTFERSGSTWYQVDGKFIGLVGGVATAGEGEGTSVAYSGDWSTMVIGAPYANGSSGGAFVFTRVGNSWTQRGSLIGGSAVLGGANQGLSVALSSDGSTVILGGPMDNSTLGAAWIFNRAGTSADVNADASTDVADVFYLINYLFAGGPAPH
jgi:FG-GAP repeat